MQYDEDTLDVYMFKKALQNDGVCGLYVNRNSDIPLFPPYLMETNAIALLPQINLYRAVRLSTRVHLS